MSTICTFLVIIGTYFLGFVTGRMMKGRRSMDYLNPHKIYPNYPGRIDHFPGHDSYRPPMNWCGEEAVDEIGTTDRCAVCTKTMQDDSHVCETCIQKHKWRVNV